MPKQLLQKLGSRGNTSYQGPCFNKVFQKTFEDILQMKQGMSRK